MDFSVPVENHAFVLRCLPASDASQQVSAQLSLSPNAPFTLQRDSFGNVLAIGRIDAPHTGFTYRSFGTARIGQAAPEPAHPLFSYPSPLAPMSKEMKRFACELGLGQGGAGALTPAEQLARCMALTSALHEALRYEPGSTTVHTTAAQAFAQRAGVCQDFAHVMVAFLRWWGLPARYVGGLTVGEGATHAWAQAHVGGRWVGFDPTRNRLCDATYLVCAKGRDWADCPIERGTFTGAADQTQTVFMEVTEVEQ